MATIELIPPDPAHAPADGTRALLYPLWVITLAIRPYPRAEARAIRFSVDGVRGVPLPVKASPETVTQEVPDGVKLLPAVPEAQAVAVTRHFVKKGLGVLGGLVARIHVDDVRKVYKLFWVTSHEGRDVLVDSRSGARVPIPEDMPLVD